MSVSQEKLKELQAAVVENALEKDRKKKENLEDGMAAELEYEADALAHELVPGSVRKNKKKIRIGMLVAGAVVIAGIAAGSMAVYNAVANSMSEVGGEEICRTMCMDGSCSNSTGPGTCAFHGGVFKMREVEGVCKTVCQDGSCSNSTGPGTCAFHGGVYKMPKGCRAICKDGSCSSKSGLGACMLHDGVFMKLEHVD